MASEITFFGDEEIQFLSSVSLPNSRQALGENISFNQSFFQPIRGTTKIWAVTRHQYGISALVTPTSFCEGSSGDLVTRWLFSQAMSEEVFPIRRMKRFAGKQASNYEKTVKGESGRKKQPESIFPLRTNRD